MKLWEIIAIIMTLSAIPFCAYLARRAEFKKRFPFLVPNTVLEMAENGLISVEDAYKAIHAKHLLNDHDKWFLQSRYKDHLRLKAHKTEEKEFQTDHFLKFKDRIEAKKQLEGIKKQVERQLLG